MKIEEINKKKNFLEWKKIEICDDCGEYEANKFLKITGFATELKFIICEKCFNKYL